MERRKFKPDLGPLTGQISSRISIENNFTISDLDFEQIKKTFGLPITGVCIDLPFCIHLEDGIYPVSFQGKMHIIKNKKISREKVLYTEDESENCEMPDDPRGIFRYSQFELFYGGGFPSQVNQDDLLKNMDIILNDFGRRSLLRFNTVDLQKFQKIKLSSKQISKHNGSNNKDLRNRMNQMIVNLSFDKQQAIYNEQRFFAISKYTLKVVKRFLDVYREITKSYYIPDLRSSDIIKCTIHYYREGDGRLEGSLPQSYPNGVTFSVRDYSEEIHERIWDYLVEEIPIDLHQ